MIDSCSSDAWSAKARRKDCLSSDVSKAYTDVPRYHVPPKGPLHSLLSRLVVECGLNLLDPTERIFAIAFYILLLGALIAIPFYVFNSLLSVYLW